MLTIHRKIIEKDLHECQNKILENFGDDSLELSGFRFQPEHHDDCYEQTLFCHEGRLFFIIWVHLDLIIATKSVLKTIAIVADNCIQNVVSERECKRIHDRGCIEFSVVNPHPNLTILLSHYYNRT